MGAHGSAMLVAALVTSAACAEQGEAPTDAAASDAGTTDAADARGGDRSLPRRHSFDPERAARGRDALLDARGADLPLRGLRSLWIVWGGGDPGDEAYWREFSRRYGFVPRDGSLYPWGVAVEGDTASIQCLACHVDRVAGETVIGAANGRIELTELYEDLVRLADLASMHGYPAPPIPELWHDAYSGRTGAPGATDAFGMGMTLASSNDDDASVETRYGYQQPPAWWQLPFKDRAYTDGFAPARNFRLMLATSLASGTTLAELRAMEPAFEDIRHYLLSLEPPPWPFEPPDPSDVEEGLAIFEERCASCHGSHGGASAGYPDRIVDVGTDPIRHERLGEAEASWINAGWFGQPPVEDTEGYLAPPLVGVWATAPYLHNGSVPDLRALLRPSERPARWKRVDAEDDYDPERVGVRFEPADAGDPEGYDTTREGLSAAGHEMGAALSDAEIDALLAYLITL